MEKSLRKKLSLSYILVTILCVVLISFLSNFFLQKQFKNYVTQEYERKNKAIVTDLNAQYTESGKWNVSVIESIGRAAIENGLFISVKDSSGNIIWDASTYNDRKCEDVKSHLTNNMETYFPKWKGIYTTDEYSIISNSNKVGIIQIGSYGSFYYNDNDILYLKTLNKILIVVGIVSLFIALLLGVLMAEGVSRPILKVIDTAEMISKGNYNQRIHTKSDIKEINKLMTTINNLGISLFEQEKLRKRLTRDVSHELRTPLSTLQSHMEAIIDGVWEPSTDRLLSCHEEILRLKRLVGHLERLAKYESENLSLNKISFNLGEAVKNILLNFEKEFLNKEVGLEFDSKEISIVADKDKISQIIINLVSNALKYTLKGGKVRIHMQENAECIEIFVIDTGIGISEADLSYVFERFYRADESRNRGTGGFGIGLTITKSIIEAHNGTITVESKINEGSKFTVRIPKE